MLHSNLEKYSVQTRFTRFYIAILTFPTQRLVFYVVPFFEEHQVLSLCNP